MPFDKNNAAESGSIGGKRSAEVRWSNRNPQTIRSMRISLPLSSDELSMIDGIATTEGISRAELIVRAVRAYQANLKQI